MGFFRKLFGGSDEVAAVVAAEVAAKQNRTAHVGAASAETGAAAEPAKESTLGDPYRGSVLVEEPAEEPVEITKGVKPVWHWRSRVLCIEPGKRLPLRSMVYTGRNGNKDVVRRITFGDGGYRLDWEHAAGFKDAIEGWIVRVDDRVLVPRKNGVAAMHVVTGELCWELPHPSRLIEKTVREKAGGLVMVFGDQRWMCVEARDGSTIREGALRNDREKGELLEHAEEIGADVRSSAIYGGSRVEARDQALDVESDWGGPDEPKGPSTGKYPLDEGWEARRWMTLAGGKLVVRLERSFNSRTVGAVALFDPTSLEPLQLLELGNIEGGDAWLVDDMVAVDADLKNNGQDADVMFIVDPHLERVVAMFDEDGRDAFLFDRDGARVWTAPL